MKHRAFIVKIQLPITSSEPDPPALAYDQSHSYIAEVPITAELHRMMRGRLKAYFHAKLEGDELVIGADVYGVQW